MRVDGHRQWIYRADAQQTDEMRTLIRCRNAEFLPGVLN